MLRLILLGSLMLSSGVTLGEEVAPPIPSTNTENSATQPDTPVPPPEQAAPLSAEVAIKTECPPPPVPVESDTDKLHKRQNELAFKKIELFRRIVKDTAHSKGAFSLFSSAAIPVDGDLLREMDRFTVRHIDLPETAEVYHLKALVHQRTEAYPAAALNWLMLLVIYPDSSFTKEAEKRLKELGGDQLKKQAAVLKDLQQKTKSLQGDRDHRMAGYLSILGKSVEPDFAVPIASECSAFLASNQTFMDEDVIEHAHARQAMMIDHQIAIYHFEKLLALHPDSLLRPDSLLSIATVQRKGQQAYEQAAKSFQRLISQYPDSAETRLGYESLAAMFDEDMRDYPNALKTYDAIVNKYKDGPIVLRALRNMALIFQSRMNQPAKAVESHLKIADIFKGVDGLDALNKAEKIAQFSMRDWKLAIDINGRIIALSPGSDDAAKAMYSNADITESKLQDKAQAKALYEQFIASFPGHALTKDAQRRITAMEQK